MKKMISALALAVFCTTLPGCAFLSKKKDTPPAMINPEPARMTKETVINAEDGDRVVIHFPTLVEEPVTFHDDETGQWATSAKMILPNS